MKRKERNKRYFKPNEPVLETTFRQYRRNRSPDRFRNGLISRLFNRQQNKTHFTVFIKIFDKEFDYWYFKPCGPGRRPRSGKYKCKHKKTADPKIRRFYAGAGLNLLFLLNAFKLSLKDFSKTARICGFRKSVEVWKKLFSFYTPPLL